MKPENRTVTKKKGIKEIIINRKGTKTTDDEDDYHELQTADLKKRGLTFQDAQTLTWGPLIRHDPSDLGS